MDKSGNEDLEGINQYFNMKQTAENSSAAATEAPPVPPLHKQSIQELQNNAKSNYTIQLFNTRNNLHNRSYDDMRDGCREGQQDSPTPTPMRIYCSKVTEVQKSLLDSQQNKSNTSSTYDSQVPNIETLKHNFKKEVLRIN